MLENAKEGFVLITNLVINYLKKIEMKNKTKEEIILPSCFFYKGEIVKTIERSGLTSIVQNCKGENFLVSNAKLEPVPKCEHEGKHNFLYCPLRQILEKACSNYFCRNYKKKTEK